MKKINKLIFLISIISIMMGCGQGSLKQKKKQAGLGKAIFSKNPNGAVGNLDVSRALLTKEIRENSRRDISNALRVDNVEGDANKKNKGTGEQGAGKQVAGEQEVGKQGAGEQGAGEQVAGEQEAGEQEVGKQGAGKQGAGEQGAGKQGAGEQGAGEQGAGKQGAGEQGAGEQGAGKQGAGKQGAGKQGAGEQGAGEQGAGEQGAGKQRASRDLAHKILTLRLNGYIETLNSKVDELVFMKAGVDPKAPLFGDQRISGWLHRFNRQDAKNKIYLALENDIQDIMTLKNIFKYLNLSIEVYDSRYKGSEGSLISDILYRLCNISEYSFDNLRMNFNQETLDLIKNCDSAEKISAIDLKLAEFIDIRKDMIYKIKTRLDRALSNRERGNKERMLDLLKGIADSNGNIYLGVNSLRELARSISHLIRSL
ncbi:hypothetical protein BOFE_08660 (plasmid) [Candidatus Borrelia fainii]|uniref:Lipoprotein n=1 Tax=Candidatus Borrelia fainii TaxID=2518322 RepID=A0ABM8DL67_9SPIR|nr:hypothetical protein [Candidatus Borrelia fainii]BDU63326.1 hypothetical protein BOFE_08660 [Candidatus Borrelia fainii]